MALVHVESETAYPLLNEPLVRPEEQGTAPKAPKTPAAETPKKRGRPKGRKTQTPAETDGSAFVAFVQTHLQRVLALIRSAVSVRYFVYDGAFGHAAACQMVKGQGLHLISKLRHDAALYFDYAGGYAGRGRPRRYGERITLDTLSEAELRDERIAEGVRTRYYQVKARHKRFPGLLNVLILVKTQLKTGRTAQVVLFSDDLELAWELLLRYYQLRFQIEFTFRDAKQYWGLEDFMNVKETQVTNAANFSLFMVTFAQLLARRLPALETGSMQDLKTVFRARKYARRIINALGLNAEAFIIDERVLQAAEIGRIHSKAA
jgi:putative transposase